MKNTKKSWTVEQKINLVIGFTNSGMSKKEYCEKYGADPTVFHRWEKAYANGELGGTAKKATAPKQTKVKTKSGVKKATTKKQTVKVAMSTTAKPKQTKKTAKTVVKESSVKPTKRFSFWTRKADKATILSLCADNESYAVQLKDSRNENANLRSKTKDLEKQVAYLQNLVDRMTWSA